MSFALATKLIKKGAGFKPIQRRIQSLAEQEVLVGITQAKSSREKNILEQAAKLNASTSKKLKKKGKRFTQLAQSKINNAELMYIHTHGSPIKSIPARPVIEPAIKADGNRQPIMDEMKQAALSAMKDDQAAVTNHLRRAGATGQNVSRAWFTDSRNGWAPNRPSTIRRKGSDRPLIDTGELRKSIIWVIRQRAR